MKHSDFVHLHVHTQYSLLDGACLLPKLIKMAADYHMPALAITDHGNMFGAIDFYESCINAGVKPIIGCEIYIATGSRHDKIATINQEKFHHFTLLAKDETGYKNLMKLVSIGFLEGFYYKPRIDKESLAKYSKGLIGLSGCLKGQVQRYLSNNDMDNAVKTAGEFRDILSPENFYIEIMDNSLPEQKKISKNVIEIAKKLGLGLVCTNDVHYLKKQDAYAHEALLCIQTQAMLDDPNRMRLQTDEFYFKSPDEMKALFAELPEAVTNTMEISNRCNLELDFKKVYLPHYKVPDGIARDKYLRALVDEGLIKRYKNIDDQLKARVDMETSVINKSGYASYFLIAWDFVNYAKQKGIPVGPGRGSAAGSVVSYALGITDIDPLKYDLIFERFLNPERVSLPDIDIDFCYERRGEVIDYVVQKYGKDNVAQIITFGTMQARAVVRDVGRVMNIPYADVDRIAKLIPAELDMCLEKALDVEPELAKLYKTNSQIRQLIDTSKVLEGLSRHASTHAAGVVISEKPLSEHIPLYKVSDDDQIITGYPMGSLEKIGLLKMDFLGLRTLTVIAEAVKLVKKTKGVDIDINNILLDDDKTFKLLAKAQTFGVFQLESSGMRDLLKKLCPTTFEDIIALLALYRPGPIGSGMLDDFIKRKHGHVRITYDHPALEPILKETYGIVVYQEQVMRIASALSGFTMSQADSLRRAMAKKYPEVMEKMRVNFIEGALKNGVNRNVAEKVFGFIEFFAGYGFNKCVVGSTEIIDAESGKIVTAKELFDKKGEITHTFGIDDNLKVVKVKIKDVINNGVKSVYKLKTSLGREIVATSNHPFFTFNGWKNLGDLHIGERVGLPKVVPASGCLRWEPFKIVVLAGLLSEGNTCHPSGFYYYNNSRIAVDDFVLNLGCFDNTIPKISTRRGRFEVYAGTGKDTKFFKNQEPWNKGFCKENYNSAIKAIANKKCGARVWVEKLGLDYKGACDKFIPNEIFSLDKEQLALFVGRLWSGDGFVFSKNNTIPFYASSSHKLCHQLQDILLRFGIVSRSVKKIFNYKYKQAQSKKIGYALYLYGYDSIKRFILDICPYIIDKQSQIAQLKNYYGKIQPNLESKDTLPVLVKQIVKEEKDRSGLMWKEIEKLSGICMKEFAGWNNPKKKGFRRNTILQLAHFFESARLFRYADADIVWDRVKSVEYIGREKTFDLEIENTHNFIANGVIVHNSHSNAYAMISYRTAYLKANYPIEFMTALLTSERANTDKVVIYREEAERMGIKVLPPDVNESELKFTVVGNNIRFGLSAVKNVGEGAIESILAAREKLGNFKSLYDFCESIDSRLVNKKVLESLIKCGAFDSFKLYRSQLMEILNKAMEIAGNIQRDRSKGQMSFFDNITNAQPEFKQNYKDIPDIREWPESQLLSFEKQMLGFYVTGHPLAKYEKVLKTFSTLNTARLKEGTDNQVVSIGGIISRLKNTVTKKSNEKMAIAMLEDLDGTTEVLVFPKTYESYGKYVRKDAIVFVKGRLSLREERPKIIADEIIPLDQAQEKYTIGVVIKLFSTGLEEESLYSLKDVLLKHHGQVPVFIDFTMPEGRKTTLELGRDFYIEPKEELVHQIEDMFGSDVVRFKV